MENVINEIDIFLSQWEDTAEQNKQGFIRLKKYLLTRNSIQLEFHPRPGVTYSLRGVNPSQKKPLRVMIDVIEDEPRWLSVCFYGEMISDPEERGAFVPGGLLGEDALCFDLDSYTDDDLRYVEARIEEACGA